MDEIGGYVDPLRLVRRIPAGLAIPRLRDRLVRIIADFRTQASLRQGCAAILEHDCLALAQARAPLRVDWASCPRAPSTAQACRHAAEVLTLSSHARAQRLYAEVRRALHAFYVKPRAGGGSGGSDGWVLWEHGGRKRLPADANALPGPVGGQRLLVKPQAAADGNAGELPKARRCHAVHAVFCVPQQTLQACNVQANCQEGWPLHDFAMPETWCM